MVKKEDLIENSCECSEWIKSCCRINNILTFGELASYFRKTALGDIILCINVRNVGEKTEKEIANIIKHLF